MTTYTLSLLQVTVPIGSTVRLHTCIVFLYSRSKTLQSDFECSDTAMTKEHSIFFNRKKILWVCLPLPLGPFWKVSLPQAFRVHCWSRWELRRLWNLSPSLWNHFLWVVFTLRRYSIKLHFNSFTRRKSNQKATELPQRPWRAGERENYSNREEKARTEKGTKLQIAGTHDKSLSYYTL